VSGLYDLLYRFREYLLLLLAILLSFVFIFSNDNPQVDAFQAKVSDFFGVFQRPFLELERLGDLEEENARLEERIVELSLDLQQVNEAILENQRLRKLLRFQQESQFDVKPAKIINRGGSTVVNSITINLGSQHQIERNRAVVIAEGVVGKTVNVGSATSIVQLLTDVNFRLSAKTQRTRAHGILVWQFEDLCALENVPKSLDIQVGDTVITSGYSDIFPEGLLVGKVIETSNEVPGYHKKIQVQTFVDFNQLEEVFVITSKPAPPDTVLPSDSLNIPTDSLNVQVEPDTTENSI
jgi:rod shape-determining protein MreC